LAFQVLQTEAIEIVSIFFEEMKLFQFFVVDNLIVPDFSSGYCCSIPFSLLRQVIHACQ
jgi:hypothetical protein